jgi:hypothetical protein
MAEGEVPGGMRSDWMARIWLDPRRRIGAGVIDRGGPPSAPGAVELKERSRPARMADPPGTTGGGVEGVIAPGVEAVAGGLGVPAAGE